MRTFTDAQLQKLTTKPYWIQNSPFFSSRVFAGSEGWMIQPTKVHPEAGKQLPPYCLVAIPNLDQLIEGAGVTGTAYQAQAASGLFYTNVSATRRSATRYMINVALGEQIRNNEPIGGNNITFTLGASAILSTASTLFDSTASVMTYDVAPQATTGRIQFDVRFTSQPDEFTVNVNSPNLTVTAGSTYIEDLQGNSMSSGGNYSWDAATQTGIDPSGYKVIS